jgi:hypothetical protein
MFAFVSLLLFVLLDSEVLIFLMHFRPNEVSNELVSEILKSDSALKITVGVADLLIFPSTILPERNHCKFFSWRILSAPPTILPERNHCKFFPPPMLFLFSLCATHANTKLAHLTILSVLLCNSIISHQFFYLRSFFLSAKNFSCEPDWFMI